MKIKICDKNKEKINEVLRQEQGRAKVRTICYDDLAWLSSCAEQLLEEANIPKKGRVGFQYEYAENDTAKAYRSAVNSTYVKLERSNNKQWFIVEAERRSLFAGDNSIDKLLYPINDGIKLISKTIISAIKEKRAYIQQARRVHKQIIVPENIKTFEKQIKILDNIMDIIDTRSEDKIIDYFTQYYPEYVI